MNVVKLLLLAVITVFSTTSLSYADEKSVDMPDKYEGIAITVNINQAGVDELATLLLGVGEAKATRIVAYRTENGPFKTVDDLAKVKGIGLTTVDKNRERILL